MLLQDVSTVAGNDIESLDRVTVADSTAMTSGTHMMQGRRYSY